AGGQAALWARGGAPASSAAGTDGRTARIEGRLVEIEEALVAVADLSSALQTRLAQMEAVQGASAAGSLEQLAAVIEAQRALNEELGALARHLPVRTVDVPRPGPEDPPPAIPVVSPPPEDPRDSPRARWILDRLGSDNPRVRSHALRDVPALPSGAALLPEVVARFEDEYGFVRQAAYEAAEAIGDPLAVSALIARARAERLPVERLLALRALGAIRKEPVDWPALTEDEIEAVLVRWSDAAR
ncbi:MAG: HEAT repeat domain-containing protein, partial [Planctomycetes bacterium]|nr:HEAT repeat domain-containing protein [Planctomycetota bacterium]